jgi:hypothetical protein
VVEVVTGAHVARLGSSRGVDVGADLHAQDLQGGTVARSEEQVEDLTALRLGIVDEQRGGRSGGQCPDAVEPPAGSVVAEHEGPRHGLLPGAGSKADLILVIKYVF